MSSPLQIPGAKRTLIVSLVMSMLGFAGVVGSISNLAQGSGVPLSLDPSLPVAAQQSLQALAEALVGSSTYHGLCVANLLASALLLGASFALTGRTRNAIWWTTQALIANALYAVAAGIGSAYLLRAHADLFVEALRAVALARSAPVEGMEGVMPVALVLTFGITALSAALYLVLLRMTRREDVRRFVSRNV